MYQFKRTQHLIQSNDIISRQYHITEDVNKYAVLWKLTQRAPFGKGRVNVPTLADVYEHLTIAGLDAIERDPNQWPTFTEIGQPHGSVQTRVKFTSAIDTRLRALKTRIDAGEFKIVSEGRKVTKISIISLVVNLMQLAIAIEKTFEDQIPI